MASVRQRERFGLGGAPVRAPSAIWANSFSGCLWDLTPSITGSCSSHGADGLDCYRRLAGCGLDPASGPSAIYDFLGLALKGMATPSRSVASLELGGEFHRFLSRWGRPLG